MGKSTLMMDIVSEKTKSEYLIKAFKWIFLNIIIPLLPIFVKVLVNIFTQWQVKVFELNEVLFYNFFTCLLLFNLINSTKKTFFYFIVDSIIVLTGFCDIVFIAWVSTEQHNSTSVWVFAIFTTITCVIYGSVFIIIEEKQEAKKAVSTIE